MDRRQVLPQSRHLAGAADIDIARAGFSLIYRSHAGFDHFPDGGGHIVWNLTPNLIESCQQAPMEHAAQDSFSLLNDVILQRLIESENLLANSTGITHDDEQHSMPTERNQVDCMHMLTRFAGPCDNRRVAAEVGNQLTGGFEQPPEFLMDRGKESTDLLPRWSPQSMRSQMVDVVPIGTTSRDPPSARMRLDGKSIAIQCGQVIPNRRRRDIQPRALEDGARTDGFPR